jgi:ribonuclease BN (tRNA processing enzyme)
MNLSYQGALQVYSIPPVFKVLSTHLLNGKIYPNFLKWPEHQPAVKFIPIELYQPTNISGYSVLAVPVPHTVPAVGFQVASPEGKKVFYTGDTGVGLSACWEYVSPHLLVTEVSLPQQMEEWAIKVAHLTPGLLKAELLQFRQAKGYIPSTILIHINPALESEIEREVAQVAEELGASIALGREGMKIRL